MSRDIPLRRVHADLRSAIEHHDWARLATSASHWHPSRKHKTLMEFALRQIEGEHAVAELVRLGYPVSPDAVCFSLEWMDLFDYPEPSLVAWHALRPAVVGRDDLLTAVVRGLERASRPSMPWTTRTIPWEELRLEGLFSPAQWQVPLKQIHTVFSETAKSHTACLSLTPLQYAWALNRPAMCEAFIRAGAPLDEPATGSWRGWTFQEVVVEGDVEAVARAASRLQVRQVRDKNSETWEVVQQWQPLLKRLPALLRARALEQTLPPACAVLPSKRF